MHSELHTPSSVASLRIGMLTPSSNTALEPLTCRLVQPLGDSVSVHFSRFRVTQIALDDESNEQFAQAPILDAASLLADAKCDLIAWNGTAASWLGFEADHALCQAITERTGVPSTSAILALNAILESLDVRTLGLVTPYTADVQDRIATNYADHGVRIFSEAHAGLRDNFSFAEITESEIEAMIRRVAKTGPDAIAIVCTNMRGPLVAARMENELGIPILDSIAFTLAGCLSMLGKPAEALLPFGRLFGLNAAPHKETPKKTK